MSKYVHVEKTTAPGDAFKHDLHAAVHHGAYAGLVHHEGKDCRAFKFPSHHDAKMFHSKVTASGHKAHMTADESDEDCADEAASFDRHLAEYIHEYAIREPEEYQAFVDVEEACAFAEQLSKTRDDGYVVMFSKTYEEFRVGPAEDVELWSLGCSGDDCVVAQYVCGNMIAEGSVNRHSFASRLSRSRALHTTMDVKRRKIATTAKMWRLKNKSRTTARKSLYSRPSSPLGEAILSLRLGVNIKDIISGLLA